MHIPQIPLREKLFFRMIYETITRPRDILEARIELWNERTGNRLTLRHFEKEIDKWARLLNIQKLQSIKPSGKEYRLVTLMGLREAGKRHHDLKCGDPDVSAKAAGHSMETKAKYYKKVSYEEAQESFSKHHPAFVEGW